MGTNSYVAKLKAQLDQAITQRDHWKQLAHKRNYIEVSEIDPESRTESVWRVDADAVRRMWAQIRHMEAALAVGDLLTAKYGMAWMEDPTGYRKEVL